MSTQIATEDAVNVDQVTEEVGIKGTVKKVGGLETSLTGFKLFQKLLIIIAWSLEPYFNLSFCFLQIQCVTPVP